LGLKFPQSFEYHITPSEEILVSYLETGRQADVDAFNKKLELSQVVGDGRLNIMDSALENLLVKERKRDLLNK